MKNKFQSKSVPRGTRTIWRYLSAFILLFSLSIGQMWADTFVNLRTVDFTEMTKKTNFANGKNTISDAGYTDLEFYQKNTDKPLKLNNASGEGIDFSGQNIGNSHFVAIPLTGINGQLKVTVYHKYSSGKASFKLGLKTGTTTVTPGDYSTNAQTPKDAANADVSCYYTYGTSIISTATTAVLFVGEAGTSYTQIKKVVIETLAPTCTNVAAPTGLSCTAHTENSLTFGWTAAEHASSYDVKLWTNSGCSGDPVASANVTGTSKEFTSLSAATTYYCKVQSKGDGTTYCAEGGVTSAASGTTDTPSSPVDPTLTYNEGAYTIGATALDLSSLINEKESSGAITYSVKTDGGTNASISGTSFTAENEGTCVVTASQAAVSATYNAKSVDFNVVVSAAPAPCATLTPATSGDAPAAGDEIVLQSGSTGGSIKALTANISYSANGLLFGDNSSTKAEVTLNHLMKVGTVITATIYNSNNDKNRGLNLLNSSGTSKATWTKNMIGDHVETYTVVAGDGLAGSNVFQLQRNNNAYLKSLTVSNCGAELFTLSSAVTPTGKGTVTLSKSLLAEGATATATYSAIDAAYDFDEWVISGATIDDAKANPVTITMGSTAATITLKLKAAEVKHTVTYYDGETELGTELVVEGENPTATGIAAPKKIGYTFAGWSTTNGGDATALSGISVAADMPLYAVYNAVNCSALSGTIFSLILNNAPAANCTIKNATGFDQEADLIKYGTVSGGIALAKNSSSNNHLVITTDPKLRLLGGSGKVHIQLDCALQEGDKIRTTIENQNIAYTTTDVRSTTNYFTKGAAKELTITKDHVLENASEIYLWSASSSDGKLISLEVIRPVKYTVSFNLNGQSATAIDDQKVAAGGKVTEPDPAPEVEGQAFGGWFTDAACTEGKEWAFATATVSQDTTLYAKWTALKSMTLVANGSGEDDVVSYPTVGDPVAVPANPFTYAGYVFTGWAYSSVVTWVDETHFTMPDANLTLTAQWMSESAKVQIVETSAVYETLAEAIAAAEAGQTVKLLQDIEQADGVAIAKNLILDLNGKTYTCTSGSNVNSRAIKITAGTVTIQNGSIIAVPTANFEDGCYGPIRIEGATANVTLEDLTLQNGRHYGLGIKLVEGALRMEDCTVISQNGGGGLEVGEATADVINCTFTQTGLDNAHAWISTCLATCDNGVLNVQGGTYTSEHYSMYVYTSGGEMNVESGSFTGDVVNKVTPASYPDAVGTINISGGTFEGVGEEPIHFTTDNTGKTSIAISGGSFDAPVAEEYCATGYVPETKANGQYGVIVPAQSIDFEAIIDALGTGAEGKAELDAQLAAKHYDIVGTLNDDRLDNPDGKPYDKGFKVKKTDLTISFSVEAGKVVEITTGSLSGASIKVDAEDAVAMTASHTHTYYSDDAQAFLITMTAASNKYNIFKSINIRDPYVVSFNDNGGDAPIAPRYGTLSVTLPTSTKGTDHFIGWYDKAAEEGSTLVGLADAEFTPTSDTTLYAHYAAQSNDATLASWEIDGVDTPVPTEPGNLIHRIEVPYGTAVSALPKITAAVAHDATYAQSVVIYPTDGPEWQAGIDGGCYVQQVIVTAEDGTQGFYHVRTKVLPKDMLMMIKATHDGTATGATIEGYYGGEKDKKTANNGKLGGKEQYFGIKLDDEAGTFQAGDVLKIYAESASSKVRIYSDKGTTRINETDGTFDTDKMFTYTLTDATEWIYLYRKTDGESDMNPTLGYMAVYRAYPNPLVNTITFNGAAGTVDNDLKTITVEVPASTNLATMPVEATFLSNDPSQTNGAVTGGTWAEGDNEYIVTDKDGDKTTYTVTISIAVPSNDATLSALSYGGTAISLADGVYEYDVELPYGTSDVPALAATAHHAGASVTNIDDAAAFVNRHATSTVTVTAEDGTTTQDYTVNFTISAWNEVVIWDGSYMTELATSPGALGMAWEVNGFGSISSYSTTTYGEKAYTKYLPSGGTAPGRYMTLTVPAGYVAKFYVVMASHSTGNERGMFIGSNLVKDPDATSVLQLSNNDRDVAVAGMSEIVGAGTWYINPNASIDFQEIRAYLRKGYVRDAMLGAGVYGTICVDHNVAVEDIQGATMYELMGREPEYGKLAFDEIVSGALEAGVPYVFQAHGDKLILFYGDTKVDDPVDKGNGMYGTFTDQTLTDLTDVYYFAQKALWSCVDLSSLSVPANRAYVKLTEVGNLSDPNPAPGRRRVTMGVNGKNTATGIDAINASDKPMKLIIDGNIYIIRGEKMYDVTGKLVK